MDEEYKTKDNRPLKDKVIQSIKDTPLQKSSLSEQIKDNKEIVAAVLIGTIMLLIAFFATFSRFTKDQSDNKHIPTQLLVSPTPDPTDLTQTPQLSPSQRTDCIATGCSGEICANEEMASPCIYKEEFGCYELAKCEIQVDGECGWTIDEELATCLQSFVGEPSL